MSIDWEKLDMERQIEQARDDVYHAEKRMKEQMRAMREDYDYAIESSANTDDVALLAERVTQLEKTVAELLTHLAKEQSA